MAWQNKEKIAVMDPVSMVGDVMSLILREEGAVLIKGAIRSFSSLLSLMKIRRLDIIFSEIYDVKTTIIEGVNYLREIKKTYPTIDVVIHTDIELPSLLIQSNADFIHMKKLGIEGCRDSLREILKVGSILSVLFHEEKMANYNYEALSDIEWKILMEYSRGLKTKDIANIFNTTVQSVSRRKRIIMRKMKIKNNTSFNNLLAASGRKLGEHTKIKVDAS